MALWVFGYGSLLWNPGFDVVETQAVTLDGYVRSFCMTSIHYRGTLAKPGLVLALDQVDGANCLGLAMRVCPGREESALNDLRKRELISSAYVEKKLPIVLENDIKEHAVVYVIDRKHRQYVGDITLEEQAQRISRAVGERGPNTEYLFKTVAHLRRIGLKDPKLDWLEQRVRQLTASDLGDKSSLCYSYAMDRPAIEPSQ